MRIEFLKNDPIGTPEEADSSPPKNITKKKTTTRKTAAEPPMFSIQDIPGKGRGLIASRDIPQGARILSEKPLFQSNSFSAEELERDLIRKVNALNPPQRADFLALHDNFPDSIGFSGIYKTNALPCGEGSTTSGIYPTICLINHSCLPNAHHSWNSATRQETIHAIRPINTGDEIVISYTGPYALSSARLERLQLSFGFRSIMEMLDAMIVSMAHTNPSRALGVCLGLDLALKDEYQGYPGILAGRLYYDAFQICAADGDRERVKIFAEKTYTSRLMCEGEDSADVEAMKPYMDDPRSYYGLGLLATPHTKIRWHCKPPSSDDTAKFDEWLWRQEAERLRGDVLVRGPEPLNTLCGVG
ncbi:hypothetical protein F5X68DRAFT_186951 [Plectosphaerella plurivora]|uniref:SET domain-containing protein n=1 Tax=Plectosphaerella plurivora TaxID=936078 RepID=A0A9P8VLS2_9PEZI|nr:hypothetical protein F5X68DRAFT_186951 [Plectosphaerella plurivora]